VRPHFRITHNITVGNVDFSRELTHMILDGLKKMAKKIAISRCLYIHMMGSLAIDSSICHAILMCQD